MLQYQAARVHRAQKAQITSRQAAAVYDMHGPDFEGKVADLQVTVTRKTNDEYHWAVSENNRRAKYYELTATGRKQLSIETGDWKKLTSAVDQILGMA